MSQNTRHSDTAELINTICELVGYSPHGHNSEYKMAIFDELMVRVFDEGETPSSDLADTVEACVKQRSYRHRIAKALHKKDMEVRSRRNGNAIRSAPTFDPTTTDFVIAEFVATLPTSLQAVAELRFEGFSSEEIATLIDKSPRVVRRLLSRFRSVLNDFLS